MDFLQNYMGNFGAEQGFLSMLMKWKGLACTWQADHSSPLARYWDCFVAKTDTHPALSSKQVW
jgi:hypothetical protein